MASKHKTRANSQRKKLYKYASALDTPKPPSGVEYRWVRKEIHGEEDRQNMAKMLRAHWVPVKPEDLPSNYVPMTDKWGKYDNVVTAGADLILMANTVEKVEEEHELQDFKTRAQEDEVARAERFRTPSGDTRYVRTRVTTNTSRVTHGNQENENDYEENGADEVDEFEE